MPPDRFNVANIRFGNISEDTRIKSSKNVPALGQRGNESWDDRDLENMRKRVVGRYIYLPFDFDHLQKSGRRTERFYGAQGKRLASDAKNVTQTGRALMEDSNSPMDICFRFMKSRLILTAAELDLFTRIHDSSPTAGELAEKADLDLRATTRLIDALVGLGLLEKKHGRYACTDTGLPLSSNHKETILPMILHLNGLWDTWSHLTETIQNGESPHRGMAIKRDEARQKAFIGAMHVIGRELSREIADSYDLRPFNKLLDIGGGSGTYTIAFLKKNPKMTAVLFDLEDVMPLAEERLNAEGIRDRAVLESGDFYVDELPKGCDLALLSAIIHQNSPKQNLDLFLSVYQALDPGGVILIRDHIMEDSRTHPPEGALFALNMLVNTEGGDTYTFGEVKEALEEAGFVDVKMPRKGERMDCLVEARKAS